MWLVSRCGWGGVLGMRDFVIPLVSVFWVGLGSNLISCSSRRRSGNFLKPLVFFLVLLSLISLRDICLVVCGYYLGRTTMFVVVV